MKQFWKDAIKDLPFHEITVKMLKDMYYGQDLPLGDKWMISLHTEDDMYDIRLNWDYPNGEGTYLYLSLIHICRCRRLLTCRSRWSPYH